MVSSYLDKNNLTLLYCLIPIPVTSLLVTDVSTNTTTVNWTSPSSRNGNYVIYHNISYRPLCPLLTTTNVTLIFITPYQFTTTFSYTLRELSSGMNYIITMRAGNVLGESSPVMIFDETKSTSCKMLLLMLKILHKFIVPLGSPKLIMTFSVNVMVNRITC